MRTTRKQVELIFGHYIQALGGRVAKSYDDHGAYMLDYAVYYGGFQIQRISDESSGVSTPFGMGRHSPAEMYEMLSFGLRTLEEIRMGVK